tara:strand:+ start:702 stop:1472 length:771 start_codon:yes stop_codon:yes gene_type:complete
MATDAELIAKYRQYNPAFDRYTDEEITQLGLRGFDTPMGVNTYPQNTGIQNIIGSGIENVTEGLGYLKDKASQGFDFAQQLPGMAISAITGIPFAGQILQGIGSMFRETPEQRNFMENIYSDPEYQELLSQIPGAENLNPVYGLGSGRGLMGSLGRRLETINRTLGRMTPQQLAQTSLKERKARIEELLELERQKESEFLESQRRGRRPGTGGDGGGGVQDSGGPTGGFSYDSGGRQGFGYGLRDGGLASLAHRRG